MEREGITCNVNFVSSEKKILEEVGVGVRVCVCQIPQNVGILESRIPRKVLESMEDLSIKD